MPDIEQRTYADHPEGAGESRYRAVSVLAIVSLLVSLLAVLAFWHPVLWVVPIAAVVLGLLAVVRIDRRENELLGRGLAILAICFSLFTLSAAASRYATINYRARTAAQELGLRWFEALRNGNPELAAQLSMEPLQRESDGTDLQAFYRGEPGASDYLKRFVNDAVVKALLKLGTSARVRFLETVEHLDDGRKERFYGIYAVTYEEGGELKTFFVQLGLVRFVASPRQAAHWWVSRDTLLTGPPNILARAN
jgi:hypothetical protein